MRIQREILVFAAIAAAAAPASAQTIQMNLLADIDMSGNTAATALPTSVGNSISAVAWDGTNLYVAGYNQTASTANVGIVAVNNALTAPTLGTTFGSQSIPSSRGYSELAIQNGILAAAADPGSPGNGNAVSEYTASTGALNWTIGSGNGNSAASTGLRGNGVAFNPGYVQNGVGSSPSAGTVSMLANSNGRLISLNGSTGAYVYSQSGGPGTNGAVINFTGSNGVAGGSTVWRSMAFDPATGNMYARDENLLIKAVRSGDNSFSSSTILAGGTSGAFTVANSIDNQNLAFVNSTAYGSFLIANDHTSNASGQNPLSIIDAINPATGALETLNFSNTLPTGVGAYNFSFDALSQTLAISDFGNNQVYIYRIGGGTSSATAPEPASVLLALGGAGLLIPIRRRRVGDPA